MTTWWNTAAPPWPGDQAPIEVEEIGGPPIEYRLAETLDGLYAPYALRVPDGPGPHPLVVVAAGNGGGAMSWLRDRATRYRHLTDRLLAAGYATAWTRYRSEVELGYQRGGPLVRDTRQGMPLLNRAPLEFEDEVSILRHAATDPRIDAERLLHVGVSHAGEMLLKICHRYPGLLRAGVAAEPASHEVLTLGLAEEATVSDRGGMLDIEHLQVRSVEHARARITDRGEVAARMAAVDIPVLVLGRDDDELQGIFRLTYDLIAETNPRAEWRSWAHPDHGYLLVETGPDGTPLLDAMQDEAIDVVIDFLDRSCRAT